jgi:DNA-binding transcriptional LysR family regulator
VAGENRVRPPGINELEQRQVEGAVRATDLGDESFIDHPGGWGTRIAVDRWFAAAGVQRRVAFEVGDTASIVNLVRNGLGVTFLPASIVPGGVDVRLIPVRGRRLDWEVSLAVPSNRPLTAAARAFAGSTA